MARRVFFSFHFDNDCWRTQQVRNINKLEGQPVLTPNQWEEVKKKGDAAIERWIEENMNGKSCVVVLVGSETANRPWVTHEIAKGWNEKKGVVGVRIDKLLDANQKSSTPGPNPFDSVTFPNGEKLSKYVNLRIPNGYDSKAVYANIADNIDTWIEEAINIRANT